jgi:hypothetical protein
LLDIFALFSFPRVSRVPPEVGPGNSLTNCRFSRHVQNDATRSENLKKMGSSDHLQPNYNVVLTKSAVTG